MTTRCPSLQGFPEAGPDLAGTPSVGLDQGAVPQATIAWSRGRLGRVAGGQTVAEEPGVHIRHQRPVVFGQHPHHPIEFGQQCQRLPPGRQAKAARPGSRSRRSSARSGVGRRSKAGNHLCPIQVLRLPLTMEVATWPNRPPVTPANIPCPAARHWRTTAAWPHRGRRRAARPTDRRIDVHCGGQRLQRDQDVVADGRQQPRPASPWSAKAVTANAFRTPTTTLAQRAGDPTQLASIMGAGFSLAEPSGDASRNLLNPQEASNDGTDPLRPARRRIRHRSGG
jgi:hypothetical protein